MRLLHGPADEPDRKIEAEMGGVEQDAVAAVVDVEVVAAARIDAHDQALRLRHQRAAGLAHQAAAIADRQIVEALPDDLHEVRQRCGLLVRVARGKAAADIDAAPPPRPP